VGRFYIVPGTSGLAIPAAVLTAPGASAVLPFRFPRDEFVTGILVLPRTNAGGLSVQVALASLALTVTDEKIDAMVSDSRGSTVLGTGTAGLLQVAADGLALHGQALRPFPLQRAVGANDTWRLQLQNRAASITTMAGIYLYTEDP
jgi:hypothetical protein